MDTTETDKENIAIEPQSDKLEGQGTQKEQSFTGIDTTNEGTTVEDVKVTDPQEKAKSEDCLIVIPGNSNNYNKKASLQSNFAGFRKKRAGEIKYKQFLSSKNKDIDRKDPVFKQRLREKFVETAKKYYGVPYAKRYHKPGDQLYDSPIFLDCCALVRQVVYDLREEFGFQLDRWNQGYQVDTLPIDLTLEEMKPGDLVFYSAIYYKKKLKRQKHDMVHVEIFMGGETGEQSIGARWQKGVVQLFDSFKFESTSYHSIQFHYKSIDTWLEGICRSWCSQHSWQSSTLLWAPNKKSVFTDEEEYTEADLEGPGLEDENDSDHDLEQTFFLGNWNNPALAKDALIKRNFTRLPKGMNWSDNFRFKWTQTPQEINFMRFVEGVHIVNHISNCWTFTNKITTLDTIENLKISLKSGEITTPLHPDSFYPESYKLNYGPDLVKFLNREDEGLWILKKKNCNQGRGITLIQDVKKYKDEIVTKQDTAPVETKPEQPTTDTSSTDLLLQKMKEMGIETEDEAKTQQPEIEESKVQVQDKQTEEEVKAENIEQSASVTTRKIKNLRAIKSSLGNSVIQKYIENPCLFKGKKFDLRMFSLIACTKPFIMLYSEGYVRISLHDYTLDDFDTKEGKITHMTNNAVQKKHPEYKARKEETIISLDSLYQYLSENSGDEQLTADQIKSKIEPRIKEIMRLVFMQAKDKLDRSFGCFEVLGWDFLIDEDLNPHLIEININPAYFTDTSTQKAILPTLVDDTIDIVLKLHRPHHSKAQEEDIEEVIKDMTQDDDQSEPKKYRYEFLYQEGKETVPFV